MGVTPINGVRMASVMSDLALVFAMTGTAVNCVAIYAGDNCLNPNMANMIAAAPTAAMITAIRMSFSSGCRLKKHIIKAI